MAFCPGYGPVDILSEIFIILQTYFYNPGSFLTNFIGCVYWDTNVRKLLILPTLFLQLLFSVLKYNYVLSGRRLGNMLLILRVPKSTYFWSNAISSLILRLQFRYDKHFNWSSKSLSVKVWQMFPIQKRSSCLQTREE